MIEKLEALNAHVTEVRKLAAELGMDLRLQLELKSNGHAPKADLPTPSSTPTKEPTPKPKRVPKTKGWHGSPVQTTIMKHLLTGPAYAPELAEVLNCTPRAVYQHLNAMRRKGVIRRRIDEDKRGKPFVYEAAPGWRKLDYGPFPQE